MRVGSDLGGPGGDLLSRVLRHSTIGAEEFNGRVRDGIGFWAHRSNHQTGAGQSFGKRFGSARLPGLCVCVLTGPPGVASLAAAEPVTDTDHGSDQAQSSD